MSVIDDLKAKLMRELDAIHVEIEDESWKHAGHAGATPGVEATHLSMVIVSPRFEGVGIMDQHRLVHTVLQEARERHLHALQLKTIPASQWSMRPTV